MAENTETVKSNANNMPETYSIFETGGKQYQAVPGKTLAVEKLDGNIGDTVEFKEVLLKKAATDDIKIGQPYVEGSVKAKILKHDKDKKVTVFKFKRRKKSRVKSGHRQPLTVIRIESI